MILINGHTALSDGPGVTFDLKHLATLNPPRAGRPGKLATMPDLLKRIIPRVKGPVLACLVPDQIYVDLHWIWDGYIRVGSPIAKFSGEEKHVALCLWSLWQNWPIVAEGPVRRLCTAKGCCNPHHYFYPFEPRPASMTFSLTGDPGDEAAAQLVARHNAMKKIIDDDAAE